MEPAMAPVRHFLSFGFLAASVVAAGFATVFVPLANKPAQQEKPVPTKIDFNRDVRPILSERCWKCHGPDREATAKTGGMRLDSFESATADRGGHAPIVPGKVASSEVFKRIEAAPEMRMPPVDSGLPALTAREVAVLKKWVEQGAKFETHWSFLPVDPGPVPTTKLKNWAKGPMDSYVLAGMESQGLAPEPRADLATLARRASLTLTGLPATPQEIETLLKDKRPNAYSLFVDRLLASPRYGEHQARFWLDAARYADTHGLHIDNYREVWPYRDWVVRAMNQDLPYDQFLTWQLAGDLMPDPTTEQLIATGYVRMNVTTNEGGVIVEEFQAKNTFDRVETTATAMMGITLTCARCHDHRYDPLTQEDYYRLYGFFNNTEDEALDGNLTLHQPVMKAPTPAQDKRVKALQAQMTAVETRTPDAVAEKWAKDTTAAMPQVGTWQMSGPYKAASFDAAYDEVSVPETDPTKATWRDVKLIEGQALNTALAAENASGYFRTTITSGKAVSYDLFVGSDDAIKVWLNGKPIHANKVLRGITVDSDKVTMKLTAGQNTLMVKIVNGGGQDSISFSLGDATARQMRKALAGQVSGPARLKAIKSAFLIFGPTTADSKEYVTTKTTLDNLLNSIPNTYVAKERKEARPTFLLHRGEYNLPKQKVERGIPEVFGTMDSSLPRNRMGLAKWLVDPKNPLVARVFVNRVWQQHFGTGLVKTAEDFGSQGEYPPNMKLLDYVAKDFVQKGWSMKKLHKEIVTSATFCQQSKVTKPKFDKDPENRWLARGPRYRLDAEVLRDQALYVSGLMTEGSPGRGILPYQPAGLWEAISFDISDTSKYVQDKGSRLYARSVYMFIKRTSPPPMLGIFDAPSREACTVRRARTNTPSQALLTLNETMYVESARNMAQHLLQAKGTDQQRLSQGFYQVTGRAPTPAEVKVMTDYLAGQTKTFGASPAEAKKLLAVGESPFDTKLPTARLAAWTMVCNLLLNLDEALTQH